MSLTEEYYRQRIWSQVGQGVLFGSKVWPLTRARIAGGTGGSTPAFLNLMNDNLDVEVRYYYYGFSMYEYCLWLPFQATHPKHFGQEPILSCWEQYELTLPLEMFNKFYHIQRISSETLKKCKYWHFIDHILIYLLIYGSCV